MSLRRRNSSPARKWKPPRIVEVRAGSPCEGRVRQGDLLLELDGKSPLDVLDYMQTSEERRVHMRLLREGRTITCKVRKRCGTPLGLVFEEAVFDGVRTCRNSCIFCFVDQMPPGLRRSLYIKDDDYRLSFYYGNFITLNNLTRADLQRITRLRISPLYVSLHATDPALRSQIMGGGAEEGLAALKTLLDSGIEVHLQVVLCPGINDGEALRHTMRDVLRTYPAASLAVVPVGLTAQARRLPQEIVPPDRKDALLALEAVEEYQKLSLGEKGRRIFFASDELYVMAERGFPSEEEYEGYPQLENGVGMARKFAAEALAECGGGGTCGPPSRGVITGEAGEVVMREVTGRAGIEGLEVVSVRNRLLGGTVSVTALLGGADIMAALLERKSSVREFLIPDNMLREGSFLDDLTPADVERATGCHLIPVQVDGAEFARKLHASKGAE